MLPRMLPRMLPCIVAMDRCAVRARRHPGRLCWAELALELACGRLCNPLTSPAVPRASAGASSASTEMHRAWSKPAVIPAPFSYYRPKTVAEATALLAQYGEDGRVLAGGQSLIPMMKLRLAAPEYLVDLGGIAELKGVQKSGNTI